MADNIQIGVNVNLHNQELKRAAAEGMTTAQRDALAGIELKDGRFINNTSTNHLNVYLGGQWVEIQNSEDSNKFGALIDFHSPALGVPDGTTAGQVGSGVDAQGVTLTTAASLQKGDYFIMNAAATIVGIQGDDALAIGDYLVATQDDPNSVTLQAQDEDYTLTSMSNGSISITVNGTAYVQPFNTDTTTTLADFVTAHAAAILADASVTVTSAASVVSLVSAAAGTAFTSAVGSILSDAAWSAVTVNQANVELAWLGINRNIDESTLSTGTVKFAQLTAPLVAATPLSFAAAVTAAGITTITDVSVIEDATGERILISEDYTAQTVESNVAFASVTISIMGA